MYNYAGNLQNKRQAQKIMLFLDKMEKIADYTGFDYKKEFWTNQRNYEHEIDIKTLKKCFKKFQTNRNTILDAGCGYGRLVPSYLDTFSEITLFDYAITLLDEAKENWKKHNKINYVQGNLYELPFTKENFDCAISIRTLHHITNTSLFFQNIEKCLKKDGLFIFDVPNKIHLKNRIKFFFQGKIKQLFSKEQLVYMETYVNHHPETIKEQLDLNGFQILEIRNSNFFRFKIFKRVLPVKFLVRLDLYIQTLLKKTYWSPSLYYITIKK